MLEFLKIIYSFDVKKDLHFGVGFQGKHVKKVRHLVWLVVVWCLGNARIKMLFNERIAYAKVVVDHINFISRGWFILGRGIKSSKVLRRLVCLFVRVYFCSKWRLHTQCWYDCMILLWRRVCSPFYWFSLIWVVASVLLYCTMFGWILDLFGVSMFVVWLRHPTKSKK